MSGTTVIWPSAAVFSANCLVGKRMLRALIGLKVLKRILFLYPQKGIIHKCIVLDNLFVSDHIERDG